LLLRNFTSKGKSSRAASTASATTATTKAMVFRRSFVCGGSLGGTGLSRTVTVLSSSHWSRTWFRLCRGVGGPAVGGVGGSESFFDIANLGKYRGDERLSDALLPLDTFDGFERVFHPFPVESSACFDAAKSGILFDDGFSNGFERCFGLG